MASVEENAFQIARYLLENHEKIEQVEIRDAINLSDEEFRPALKFLVDAGYCHTAGQFGKGIIKDKNLAQLQSFFNQINKGRVLLSSDAEKLLKFLFENPTSGGNSEQTMAIWGWSEKRYRNAYEILQSKRYIDAKWYDNKPFYVSLTIDGRDVVINNFRSPLQQVGMVNIENIGSNSIVNIGSVLHSVNQSIQENSYLSLSDRQEINLLLKELVDVLKQIPPENVDEAEAVEKMAKDLVENATKEKPNKKLIEISVEGLKKAAKDLSIIIPSVLLISEKLISFIIALHR